MRKITVAVLVIACALAVLGSAGCALFGRPLDDANNAIEDANTHLRAYQESYDRVEKTATELNSLTATTTEAATKALGLTSQLAAEMATQKKELKAASDLIAKVKTFDVDASFKKYADLEVAAIGAQIAVVDERDKLYAEMTRYYTAIRDGKLDAKLRAEILKNIDTIASKSDELVKTASDAKSAADKQFEITSKQ